MEDLHQEIQEIWSLIGQMQSRQTTQENALTLEYTAWLMTYALEMPQDDAAAQRLTEILLDAADRVR